MYVVCTYIGLRCHMNASLCGTNKASLRLRMNHRVISITRECSKKCF